MNLDISLISPNNVNADYEYAPAMADIRVLAKNLKMVFASIAIKKVVPLIYNHCISLVPD